MIFLDACNKRPTPYTPVWLMRQAGRYLPQYLATRAKAKDFIDFCRRPELACEATLAPIEYLGVDAAILFSDILTIPLEMGMDVEFIKGVGPVINNPINSSADIEQLSDNSADNLGYVYDGVSLIRKELRPDVALIGFAGSPWTIATYMVEGGGSKQFAKIKKMAYANPNDLHVLLKKNSEAITKYLSNQIKAGADVVQIFDSWGGALEHDAFYEFSWSYMKQISSALKFLHPTVPIILFSKGIGTYLDGIDGDFNVFGVDWNTPITQVKNRLGEKYAIQGNLDPSSLYSQEATEKGVKKIVEDMKGFNGHIFNLGHGMMPDLPKENAKFAVELVHELSKNII